MRSARFGLMIVAVTLLTAAAVFAADAADSASKAPHVRSPYRLDIGLKATVGIFPSSDGTFTPLAIVRNGLVSVRGGMHLRSSLELAPWFAIGPEIGLTYFMLNETVEDRTVQTHFFDMPVRFHLTADVGQVSITAFGGYNVAGMWLKNTLQTFGLFEAGGRARFGIAIFEYAYLMPDFQKVDRSAQPFFAGYHRAGIGLELTLP